MTTASLWTRSEAMPLPRLVRACCASWRAWRWFTRRRLLSPDVKTDARGRKVKVGGGKRTPHASKKPKAADAMPEKGSLADRLAVLNRIARGEVEMESSDEEDGAAVRGTHLILGAASDSEAEEEDLPEVGGGAGVDAAWPVQSSADAPRGDASRRLAMVTADWDKLRAVDIFAALAPFAPLGGSVRRVSVVPSEYGKKRLEEEAVRGPSVPRAAAAANASDSGTLTAGGRGGGPDAGYDPEALRAYEQSRLNYYYAVVECDSVRTAEAVYGECDGMEYEGSANTIDLRFIPDDVEIPFQPRDSATSVPADYIPRMFVTHALQATDVPLTWDADDHERTEAMALLSRATRPMTRKERRALKKAGRSVNALEDDDELLAVEAAVSKFLAPTEGSDEEGAAGQGAGPGSDSEEEGEDPAALRAKYLALLGGAEVDDAAAPESDAESSSDAGSSAAGSDDEEGAMSKTFRAHASVDGNRTMVVREGRSASERLEARQAAKAATQGESVFEAYRRQKREKRRERRESEKAARRAAREGAGVAPEEGALSADPLFSVAQAGDGEQTSGRDGPEQDAAGQAARLAMMMGDGADAESDDDADAYRGGKGRGASKKRPRKRGRQQEADVTLHDADMQAAQAAGIVSAAQGGAPAPAGVDSRFSALVSDPRFAQDPTHPAFKKSAVTEAVRSAKARRTASASTPSSAAKAPASKAVSDMAARVAGKFATAGSKAAAAATQASRAATDLSKRKKSSKKKNRK